MLICVVEHNFDGSYLSKFSMSKTYGAALVDF